MEMEDLKTLAELKINMNRCKGCAYCVEFCPEER